MVLGGRPRAHQPGERHITACPRCPRKKAHQSSILFTYIYHKFRPNVGKYTSYTIIHQAEMTLRMFSGFRSYYTQTSNIFPYNQKNGVNRSLGEKLHEFDLTNLCRWGFCTNFSWPFPHPAEVGLGKVEFSIQFPEQKKTVVKCC